MPLRAQFTEVRLFANSFQLRILIKIFSSIVLRLVSLLSLP